MNNPIPVFVTLCLFYIGWTASHRPRSENTSEETYINDSTIRKVEIYNYKIDWGTRYFPYRSLKIRDAPVKSSVQVWYTPHGGIESPLPETQYEHLPIKNKIAKPIRLKSKHFFKSNFIETIRVIVETPFERNNYETNIKHEMTDGKILKIWNNNAEEIRGFRFLIPRSTRLSALKIIKGQIISVEMTMPYTVFESSRASRMEELGTDITVSLVVNLKGRKHEKPDEILVQIAE